MENTQEDKTNKVVRIIRRQKEPFPGVQDSGRERNLGHVPVSRDDLQSGRSGGHRNPLGKRDIPDD